MISVKIKAMVLSHRAIVRLLDLVAEAESGGTGARTGHHLGRNRDDHGDRRFHHARRAQSGASRWGLAVWRSRSPSGPRFEINPDAESADDWMTLEGDGTLRRLSLDVGQVNAAFAAMDDPRAAKRALTEAPETTFIEMQVALVSHPAIARAAGRGRAANLADGWKRATTRSRSWGAGSIRSRDRAMCAVGSLTGLF